MKKALSILAAAVMTCAACTSPAFAAEARGSLGDVDMNGKVDLIDSALILRNYVSNLAELGDTLTEEQLALADVDGFADPNGRAVNIVDAKIVLDYFVGTALAYNDYGTLEEYAGRITQWEAAEEWEKIAQDEAEKWRAE